MNYTLAVRAFFNINRKDKATIHANRLFPGLPIRILGKYYKDDTLWEATLHHDCEYVDDRTALWETLTYFAEVQRNSTIMTGPNGPGYDSVVSAVTENHDQTGLTWCNFELLRQHKPAKC
jgi:hypothetical protein